MSPAIVSADMPVPPVPQKVPQGAEQLVQDREVKLTIWKKLRPRRAYKYVIDPGRILIKLEMPGPCDYEYTLTNRETGRTEREKGSLDNMDFMPVSKCKDAGQKDEKNIISLLRKKAGSESSGSGDDTCYYHEKKFDYRILESGFGYHAFDYENDHNFLFNVKVTLYDYDYIDGKPRLISKAGKTIEFTRHITITATTCDVYHFDAASQEKVIDKHHDFTGLYDEYRSDPDMGFMRSKK